MHEIRNQRLERGSDRLLGGVCAGLAQHFAVDPLLVRLIFVLLALASGAGIVLYLLLWLFVPEAGEPPRDGDPVGAGLRSMEKDLRRIFGSGGGFTAATSQGPPAHPVHRGGLLFGVLLIAAGAALLAGTAGLLTWWSWTVMWPVLVIALGVLVLVRRLT